MIKNTNLAIIILAAGKGTRMKSDLPKVMHKIAGRPMISCLIERCESLNPEKLIVVTAPDMDDVVEAVSPHSVVFQQEQKGTGDAVKPALEQLKDFKGRVLVLLADEPFLDLSILQEMVDHDDITAMAVRLDDSAGFGRIIQSEDGFLERIVEEKDCTDEERSITLCNSGNYCVPSESLAGWVSKIKNKNASGEYYLTDLPEVALQDAVKTSIFEVKIEGSWGINNRIQLAEHENTAQVELRKKAMTDGVTLIDPDSVTLSWDTKLGQDIIIEPHVYIGLGVSIEDNAVIHSFSHIEGAVIEAAAEVGPYARIRPKSVIGSGACVGNFIEINRSVIKAGAKAKHVSYLGDAIIGEKANIGAGTVIANYDGFFKHQSVVGKKVFVGSNSTIISPVEIGDGAIVAAGSNINKNIKENAMAIGRSHQENHDGWATQYRYVKKEQKKLEEED